MSLAQIGYWATARTWARKHTSLYSPRKALPSVIATLVAALLFDSPPILQVGVVIGTLLASYLLLSALEYSWILLIKAPVAVTASVKADLEAAETEVSNLKGELAKKRPIDTVREQHVQTCLADFTDEEKKFLRWLLNVPEKNVSYLQSSGLPQGVIDSAQSKGRKCMLISTREERHGTVVRYYDFINTYYREALENLLYLS